MISALGSQSFLFSCVQPLGYFMMILVQQRKKEVKTGVQESKISVSFTSVQVFISRHGDNCFVLEDAPILLVFYFPETPSSTIHLFKKPN